MTHAAKGQRKSFRNKYPALVIILLLFSQCVLAQKYTKPNNSYGEEQNRILPDSVLHIPELADTLPHTVLTSFPQLRKFNGSLWFYDGTFWKNISGAGGGMPGSGTLTNFTSGSLSPLFSTSVTNATTTPALSFTISNTTSYTIFGRGSGTGAPSYISSLDSNWIPTLHSQSYYDLRYAAKIHAHTASQITDFTTAVRNLFSGGTGITYNPTTGVIAASGGGGAGTWGTITGTLSDQGDLQAALNAKLNITDTANMLLPYFREVGYALIKSGQTVSFDSLSSAVGFHTQPYNDLRYPLLTGSYSNPSWITSIAWTKISSTPTTISGYGITDFNSLGDTRWLLKSNNLSDVANAGTARTNLGATTIGSNIFTSTNPSAITFLRANADNSVSWLDAATFRTAIGAGTGSGSVTSVGLTSSDITVGGSSPITTSGTFTLTLPTINSNVGTFNNVTVNAKGQVTAASNVSYLTSYTETDPNAILKNGSTTLGSNVTITGAGNYFAFSNSRMEEAKGANVAAANNLTLGADGNTFTITGNTQINAITNSNWQAGSKISLIFTGSPTVKHNTAGGAGTSVILLSGAADYAASTDDVLQLVYDGTSWHETTRKIAATGGGRMVYPSAGIALSTGSAWGTSITDNSANWNIAYSKRISSLAFSGTTTKTLTITLADASTVSNTFSDIGFANPMTTLGDIIYGGSSGTATRLAGDVSNTKKFLTATSSGSVAVAPSWGTVTASDVGLGNVENAAASGLYVPLTRTVNGKALSANITLGLASSDFANQGTTTTVLHGNASGNPSFGAIVTADITDANITYAKIQNVTTQTLLGRYAGTNGVTQEITIGSGLSLNSSTGVLTATNSGTVTSVSGTTNRITSTGGTTPVIDISASYVGQTSITTLGTIGTGTWNGTTIDVSHGGTGATTLTGVVIGNGSSAMTGIAGTANQLLRRNAANTAYEFFTPGYVTSESDPIVAAINGLVKSNGTTIGAVVSGTDIKTINSNSILGSGNLVTPGAATYIVAASDAPTLIKARADYICDGTADEVEIKAALLLGNVTLTEGTYTLSSGIIIPSNRTLQGTGKATILIASGMGTGFAGTADSSTVMIGNSGSEGITVKNLTINGNVNTKWGLLFTSVGASSAETSTAGVTIQNVYIKNIGSSGIELRNCRNNIISGNTMNNVYQDGITLTRTSGTNHTTRTIVSNNIVNGGFAAVFNTYADSTLIQGNIFDSQTDETVQSENSNDISLINNTINNGYDYNAAFTSCIGLNVQGNTFNGNRGGGELVVFFSCSEILVSNNKVMNGRRAGIRLDDCFNGIVANNYVYGNSTSSDNTYSGIYLTGADDIIVSGNNIKKGSGTNKQKYGIEINSTSDRPLIQNNDLYLSGVTGDIGSSSTTVRMRDNIALDGTWIQPDSVSSPANMLWINPTTGAIYKAAVPTITLTTTGTSGNATYTGGTLNIPNYTYTLPTASTSTLGGVKVDGATITISGGVISSAGGTLQTVTTAGASTNVAINSSNSITSVGFYANGSINTDIAELTQITVGGVNQGGILILRDVNSNFRTSVYSDATTANRTIKFPDASGTFALTSQITGTNSGTNTGDITLSAIGSTPNANGASLSGQVLNLQPANGSFGGVVSTTTQTFAGDKTFTGVINWQQSTGSNIGQLNSILISTVNYGVLTLNNTANSFNANLYPSAISATRNYTLPDASGMLALTSQITGTNSGTNTGDQNVFTSIPVSGQTTVTANSTTTALTLVAGTNISITTDNTAKSITINSSGGSGANSLGTYIVQTSTNAPANAQVLASLGTGLVKNTTTTGVLSIAAAGTDYQVPITAGDITTSGATATLATVNSNVGSFGSASQTATFTVNAKGLITAASQQSIAITESQVTNLTTDLAAKQGLSTAATGLTAAGTDQSTALALSGSNSIQVISTAASGTGVKLPVATATSVIQVVNRGANAIVVYPSTSGTINGQAANTGFTLQAGAVMEFNGVNTTDWYTSNAYKNGDVNTTDGSAALTLATVNSNTGSFGSSTAIPTFTVNGKGLITAASTAAVIAPAGTLTGTILNSTVVTSSLTSVGTLVNLTVTNPISGSVTGSAASFTGSLSGDVTGTQSATVVGKINGVALSGLATGILKNTTTTGVPSIAVAGTDYVAPSGTFFIGTTSIAHNRTSASQSLTGITSIDGSSATLTTSRNLWGQAFNGSADVTGSLTSVGNITGGASSMTILAGTGASRTLTFQTTTAASAATTALTLAADQSATFANTVNATTFVGALTGTASKATNLVGGNGTTLLGSIPYQSGTDATTLLSPNTTSTKKFLTQTGTGTNGAAPSWTALASSDVGLGNVENTALSTWAGSSNITTLGTVTTGTWSATTIALNKGGTGSTTQAGAANAILPSQTGNSGLYLTTNGTDVSWAAPAGSGDMILASIQTVTGAKTFNDGKLILAGATSGTTILKANATAGSGTVTLPTTGTLVNDAVTTLSSLASIGTITTGVWNGTVVGSTYGGTGVNNGSSTITLGGNLVTSGAFSITFTATATTTVTLPTTGTLATLAGTETFTNKRITTRVTSITSNATWSPSADNDDVYQITAQAAAVTTISNPSGTPTDGQKLIIRVKDNGTARALTWSGTQWRASTDQALPTTTTISKWLYIAFMWNATDSKWDCVAVNNGF